jgi:hypothetical protein
MEKAMRKRTLAALGTALAGAVVFSLTTPALAYAPTSPGGITDNRLCGSSYFAVSNGLDLHEFTWEGNNYVNGGIQHHWLEQQFWAGWFYQGQYFEVTC